MQLVADRFVVRDEGKSSTLRRVAALSDDRGWMPDPTRWAVRCDALHALHHPAIARLVDYGRLGESQRFEAWACGRTWSGTPAHAERAARAATSFLRACGLTVGGSSLPRIHQETGRPLVLPDEETGYPCDPQQEDVHGHESRHAAESRMSSVAPSRLSRVAGRRRSPRPRRRALGSEGAGDQRAARAGARCAPEGLFPSRSGCSDFLADPLRGRTLFIDDDASTGGGACSTRRSARRGRMFCAGGVEEVRAVRGLALERLSAHALTVAIRPFIGARGRRADRRAVEQADGLLGGWRRSYGAAAAPARRPASRWIAARGLACGGRPAVYEKTPLRFRSWRPDPR
jgi:hypothetical protein